jgi:hypothetical protein
MTKEELKTYSELQIKFATDVMRVANILSQIDEDLGYIDRFHLEDGHVYTQGWEYWNYGGQDEHFGEFDADMLLWTDEQLQEHVAKTLAEREAKKRKEKEHKAKITEEQERKEYERLKEKFESK